MEPKTPITPLEHGVEMFTKGRPQSLFSFDFTISNGLAAVPESLSPNSSIQATTSTHHRATNAASNFYITERSRPLSHITEIDIPSEDEEFDEEYVEESDESEFEEDIQNRKSQTTLSTWDEISTPKSFYKPELPQFYNRPSVSGPKGPHLFRPSSISSSDYNTLQLSPIYSVSSQKNFSSYTINNSFESDVEEEFQDDFDENFPDAETPITTITESAYRLPHLSKKWQRDDPKTWTTQQVSMWLEDSGVESNIIDLFVLNDISGQVLVEIESNDLKDLGIISFGKRHQIWNHIKSLKIQYEQYQKTQKSNKHLSNKSIESKQSNGSCDDIDYSLPENRRRRRKVRNNGYEPITPADSVSIIAIEQYIPKPHVCKRGENCEKYKQQKRLMKRITEEHGFPISPQNGGRIYMLGNPVQKLKEAVQNINTNKSPLVEPSPSEKELSVVGPSIVASSDLLGPGEMPDFTIDSDKLKQIEERDPQDNVQAFLSFQNFEPPIDQFPLSPLDGNNSFDNFVHQLPERSQSQPQIRSQPQSQTQSRSLPMLLPPTSQQSPVSNLSLLPRLTIPQSQPQVSHFSSPIRSAVEQMYSPMSPACRTAVDTPLASTLFRYGTPASEMDVPITNISLGPISRDTSQSVPPNMHYKSPVQSSPIQRSQSRPIDWKRPSFALPPLVEEKETPNDPPIQKSIAKIVITAPQDESLQGNSAPASPNESLTCNSKVETQNVNPVHHRSTSNSTASLSSTLQTSENMGNIQRASQSSTSLSSFDSRYATGNVTHSGWMRKRRTRLLKHDWSEAHFRLNDKAQLSMHRNDMYESSPSEVLNIDDYAVACSSAQGTSKFASRLKALRINQSGSEDNHVKDKSNTSDYAFNFQLVPTKLSGERRGVVDLRKTHHFAVKSKDDRIDWMRELMLAKALREKEANGYRVEVHKGENFNENSQ